MKIIYLRGEDCSTIKIIRKHLESRGHSVVRNKTEKYDVTVCWGTSMQELKGPNLNGKVNRFNKLEHFNLFDTVNVPHPKIIPTTDLYKYILKLPPFPLLARSTTHANGKDIKPINSMKELLDSLKSNPDFYSVFVPTKTEFRVWTFNGKAIAVYEKEHRGEKYTGQPGFDFWRSFKFEKRDDLLEDKTLCTLSVKATSSIQLDFGAVDVLLGTDGKYYILEVNSMPNIDGMERVSGIRLCRNISIWAEQI